MLLRASHEKAPHAPRPALPRRVSAVAAPPAPSETPRARFGPDGTVHIDDGLMARYASFVDQAAATTTRPVTSDSVSRPPPPSPHAIRTTMAPPRPLAVPSPLHQRAPQVTTPLARPAPLGAPSPLASPHAAPVSSMVIPHNKIQTAQGHSRIDQSVVSRPLSMPSPLPRASPLMNPTIEIALQCVVALVLARILNSWLCARS